MSTIVLGLGNPILTDDAIGPRVAEGVRAALADRPGPWPVVETLSVGGLALMEALVGYEQAVLIDALWRPGWPPGSLHRLTLEDLGAISPTARSVSPHDTSLAVALELGRQLGLALPETIVIYAVAVSNTLDVGEAPTPEVAAAIPAAVAAVLTELNASHEKLHQGGSQRGLALPAEPPFWSLARRKQGLQAFSDDKPVLKDRPEVHHGVA